MPATATLGEFKAQSSYICSLSFGELQIYLITNGFNSKTNASFVFTEYLPYYCFLSSYTIVLMEGKPTSCLA